MNPIEEKEHNLLTEIKTYNTLAIAYSGGVDSTYLADCAHEVLGHNAIMVIADSPSIPRKELKQAIKIATDRHWNLQIIQTREHHKEAYLANLGDRCFHCKTELFSTIKKTLLSPEKTIIAHGAIEDDKEDIRPGTQAANNHAVIAPLQNAKLYKKEIRILSKRRRLPTAEKASFACLGSRFPSGTRINLVSMAQVEQAEEILRSRGYTQYRVRHHGNLCRIEIETSDFEKLSNDRIELVQAIKKVGYRFITLDLCGYSTGSTA